MPKVTILMTVYNVEKYIRAAIFSMLSQSFKDFELLIINDGSTDRTEDILASFTDIRIQYIKNECNLGISSSLNKGIALANGEYVVRMDGDDISYPNRIEQQVKFMDNHKELGMTGSWYYVINNYGALRSVKRKATKDIDIRLNMLFENQFIQSSTILRTDLLKELKYDTEMEVCEDYDLFMRILYKAKVANMAKELITYRWYGENTSITKQKAILSSFIRIFSKTLDHYGIQHTKEELFIHSLLAFRNKEQMRSYFNTKERIKNLNNWLYKIAAAPGILAHFDKDIVQYRLTKIREIALSGKKKITSF